MLYCRGDVNLHTFFLASARLLHILILRGSLDPLDRFQTFLPRLLLVLLLGEVLVVVAVVDSFSAAAAAVGLLDRHPFASAAATAAATAAVATAVVAE